METTISLEKVFKGIPDDTVTPSNFYKNIEEMEVTITFSNCSEEFKNTMDHSESGANILTGLMLMGLTIVEGNENKKNAKLVGYTLSVLKKVFEVFMIMCKENQND